MPTKSLVTSLVGVQKILTKQRISKRSFWLLQKNKALLMKTKQISLIFKMENMKNNLVC